MQVIKQLDGNLIAIDDAIKLDGPRTRILSKRVTVAKKNSSHKGMKGEVKAVKKNKVIVQFEESEDYGTYTFGQLKSITK